MLHSESATVWVAGKLRIRSNFCKNLLSKDIDDITVGWVACRLRDWTRLHEYVERLWTR
jgi:hypothetical protein